MNQTVDTASMMDHSSQTGESQPTDRRALVDWLTKAFPGLSPQVRQAARHVLESPQDVALKSMRRLAADADVPPSTMVRLAKAAGFASYDEFRKVFQDAVRTAGTDLVARAQWLQRLPAGDRASQVMGGMANAIIGNVEAAFRDNASAALADVAESLRLASRVFVVGVGGMHPIAAYLYYVLRMALPDVRLAQPAMATMIDELTEVADTDAVIVLSVAPYAAETVRTAEFAVARQAKLIALTDSRASPIAPLAASLIIVPTATPQFFPSQSAVIAVLETVIALIVSHGDKGVLERIDRVDRHRRQQGVYWPGKVR